MNPFMLTFNPILQLNSTVRCLITSPEGGISTSPWTRVQEDSGFLALPKVISGMFPLRRLWMPVFTFNAQQALSDFWNLVRIKRESGRKPDREGREPDGENLLT